jgi:hypothetical protein
MQIYLAGLSDLIGAGAIAICPNVISHAVRTKDLEEL